MSAAALMRPSMNFASTKAFCNSSDTGAPSVSVRSPLVRRIDAVPVSRGVELEAFGLHRELGTVAGEAAGAFRGGAFQHHAVGQAQARRARRKRRLRVVEAAGQPAARLEAPLDAADEVLDARRLERHAELVARPAEIAARAESCPAQARLRHH